MKRPVTDLIEHLKKYNDAVLLVGSKTLQRVLEEETDEDGTTIIKREPLYFQPDERCSNIYTRKAMIKNPNIFWSFYDNIVLKDPEESTETYDLIKELLDMNLIKTVVDFNTDGTLSDVKENYIPLRGNRNTLYCVKCGKKYDISDVNLNTDKVLMCGDIGNTNCKGKIKPTVPFYYEGYYPELISELFHEIFKYDDEDKPPVGLNTHTLILIGADFDEDLIDEIIVGFNQFKKQDNLTVAMSEGDSMFLNEYTIDFGTDYDISESLKKLINMLK